MKIFLNRKRGERGTVVILIILFIIFLIVIGTIVFMMVRTVKKLVPPPPPDKDGVIHYPQPGDTYMGGTVVSSPANRASVQAITSSEFTVFIFADSVCHAGDYRAWTNCECIYTNTFAGVSVADALEQMNTTFSSTNGLEVEGVPLEQLPVLQAGQRFFNIVVSNAPPAP